jgi:hypothetical protein
MKHPVAVAIMNGFNAALAAEVQNEVITLKQAEQIGRFGLAIAMEYLKGNSVFMKRLQDFGQDGEKIESMLTANNVKLQRYQDA